MVTQLKKSYFQYLRGIAQVVTVTVLVSCSSIERSERIIEPRTSVYSSPNIEVRKIIEYRNLGQYENAYLQIRNWASDDRNLSILFQRENATMVALEVSAWKNDADLFFRILNHSPSMRRLKDAYRAAAERNFAVFHRYQRCFLKSTGASLSGCSSQVQDLKSIAPEYSDIWQESTR
jgi:hypothetical protein